MSKKSCLRVRFNKQHGKRAQTLFKSRRGQFYHIYWLLWRQMSLKNSLIVICKILRLFVNTFIAFDKSCVFSRECLRHPIHMELSQKQKNVSKFFFGFLKSRLHFEHIPKKRWHSYLTYFQNYRLSKPWLDEYQKSTASEYPWRSNMVNRPKHCWNLNGGLFIIFIDHCEGNWVWKSHS